MSRNIESFPFSEVRDPQDKTRRTHGCTKTRKIPVLNGRSHSANVDKDATVTPGTQAERAVVCGVSSLMPPDRTAVHFAQASAWLRRWSKMLC